MHHIALNVALIVLAYLAGELAGAIQRAFKPYRDHP